MSTLDAEIDELARRVERQIRRNETRLAELPEFDADRGSPTAAAIPDTDQLFL